MLATSLIEAVKCEPPVQVLRYTDDVNYEVISDHRHQTIHLLVDDHDHPWFLTFYL